MSKPTIYQVYVKVTDQPQADRLKAVCEKYGLPIWELGFNYSELRNCFRVSNDGLNQFGIWIFSDKKTEVTEPQFIALCEEWKQLNK